MTKVPQYDWGKLTPKQPKSRQTHGTLNFATHEFIEQVKKSRHGAIKVTRPPLKPIDKRLFNAEYDNRQHIKRIMDE